VRSVSSAAGGYAGFLIRIAACVQRGRKWGQAEEQNEKSDKGAPHLGIMLHDDDGLRNGFLSSQLAVRYHHGIRSQSGARESNPFHGCK
jgi:hypothetical protein